MVNYLKSGLVLSACFALLNASAQNTTSFQHPPKIIEDIVLAKPSPVARFSDDNQWMLQLELPALKALAKLAEPELGLAGTRIKPETFNVNRLPEYTGASLLNIKTRQTETIKGLPEGAVIISHSFSPSTDRILLAVEESDGVYLYEAPIQSPVLKKISNKPLNATSGVRILWLDNNSFLTLMVPDNYPAPPAKPRVPAGPVIQESDGKALPARTFQDLLTNAYEEQLFDYYFTSQLVKVSGGVVTPIGKPAVYANISLSPDKTSLLVSETIHPYSYQVPRMNFPHKYYVTDLTGKTVKELGEHPTLIIPIGHDTSSPYPRNFSWRTDKPATVFWVEAQDKGFPRENPAEFRDIVYQSAFPFDQPKQEVVKVKTRFGGIQWGDDNFALVTERSRATRRMQTSSFKPTSSEAPVVIFDLSTDDSYNNPGTPVTVKNEYGRDVLYTNRRYDELLMVAQGASDQGNMPYISRYNLRTKKNDILWRCAAPYYETIERVTDPARLQVITSRQSANEPANYFARDIRRNRSEQITHFEHPYPAMAGVTKEKISYTRADGLNLTATVYLPAGYDKDRDGRLPVIMWAYPREYTSASDAAQVRGSQYTFTRITDRSPVFWVLRGYCVMEEVEMPIVGKDGAEPNDNFIEQLTMNAEAAVNFIVDRGIGDKDRIAVGGHSYGAFMTANLLTNTNLFKAGIARSGAYNRTLTPFGFQTETRTYWEIPEIYNTMSPFMSANRLNGALLLIHGELDNNSGTFPIQTERFFSALKGHGAVSRYVVLPYESHGYAAQENVLHLLYEVDEWLEKHVKNAK
jgi:Dipeptidyl aminopeptidases/acylaminoacyl-peptidases